jgi:hypothetical protein
MGRLNLWAGANAVKQIQWEQDQHRKNREAEEAHVRKTLWESNGSATGDDVGDTYLGDITNQIMPVAPKKPSFVLPLLLGAALSATPVATAAYLLARPDNPPAPVEDTNTDTTYSVEKWIPGEANID